MQIWDEFHNSFTLRRPVRGRVFFVDRPVTHGGASTRSAFAGQNYCVPPPLPAAKPSRDFATQLLAYCETHLFAGPAIRPQRSVLVILKVLVCWSRIASHLEGVDPVVPSWAIRLPQRQRSYENRKPGAWVTPITPHHHPFQPLATASGTIVCQTIGLSPMGVSLPTAHPPRHWLPPECHFSLWGWTHQICDL
jgi:hypothetical protein